MVSVEFLIIRSKTNHACWEKVSRLDVVQRDVTGNLANCIPYSKDCIDLVQLIPFEIEIFPHPRHVSIVEVAPVEVIQKIHETAEGQDKSV